MRNQFSGRAVTGKATLVALAHALTTPLCLPSNDRMFNDTSKQCGRCVLRVMKHAFFSIALLAP